jgi:amino acid transporter
MIGDYLLGFVPALQDVNPLLMYVVLGLVIVTTMTLISARGLTGGSLFGMILAILAIVPLVVILGATFFTGVFDLSNISNDMFPPEWTWGPIDIVMLFGCFALAQWSGCAWETAALYGPEYKNPNTDVPKALFSCGIICLVLYLFVSFAVFGSLGIDQIIGVDDPLDPDKWLIEPAGYATLVPIAKAVFGEIGGALALFMLVVAMVLIIQTGFLGSSRTLFYMSQEGNMPKYMGKQNKHGMPLNAMLTVSVFNMLLVVTATVEIADPTRPGEVMAGGPLMILSASAVAYCIAHVICLSAYVKSKSDDRFKDMERPFCAPKGWKYVAMFMVGYEALVLIPCLIYWMYTIYGILTIIVGIVILAAFFPLWFYTQNQLRKDAEAAEA